jgi:polyribonucleotide nucleotidyltransferase
MKPQPVEVSVELAGGKRLSFETGKLAKQAHGAAVVRLGQNVVLATATANPDPREGIDFFPLTVDYREYTYAGGRFPGGFIKREGRMSEREDSHQPADRSSGAAACSRRVLSARRR